MQLAAANSQNTTAVICHSFHNSSLPFLDFSIKEICYKFPFKFKLSTFVKIAETGRELMRPFLHEFLSSAYEVSLFFYTLASAHLGLCSSCSYLRFVYLGLCSSCSHLGLWGRFVEQKLLRSSSFRCDQSNNFRSYHLGHTLFCYSRVKSDQNVLQTGLWSLAALL